MLSNQMKCNQIYVLSIRWLSERHINGQLLFILRKNVLEKTNLLTCVIIEITLNVFM